MNHQSPALTTTTTGAYLDRQLSSMSGKQRTRCVAHHHCRIGRWLLMMAIVFGGLGGLAETAYGQFEPCCFPCDCGSLPDSNCDECNDPIPPGGKPGGTADGEGPKTGGTGGMRMQPGYIDPGDPQPCGEPGTGDLPGGGPVDNITVDPISLRRGAVYESAMDISIPGITFDWMHARTYDSLRDTNDLTTAQGERWIGGLVETFLIPDASDNVEVHFSADAYRVFDNNAGRYSPADDDYRAALEKSGTKLTEEYTLILEDTGDIYVFYGWNTFLDQELWGRLKKRTNRYFEEVSESGITYTYNADGQVSQLTMSQGWTVTVTYDASTKRRTKVEAFDDVPDSLQKVEYTYYEDVTSPSTDIGTDGDLVQVKFSKRDSAESAWIERYTQYRYYKDADSDGDDHQLKIVLDSDAIEGITSAGDTAVDTPDEILKKGDTYSVASTKTIENYATKLFTYYGSNLNTNNSVTTPWGSQNLSTKYGGTNVDETGLVKTETVRGDCGSCGGGSAAQGTKYTLFYMELDQGASPALDEVTDIVVMDKEDGSGAEVHRQVFGMNDLGRLLRNAIIEDPTESTQVTWCASAIADADNMITETRMPSAHALVDTDSELKKFLDPEASTNDADTLENNDGVIYLYSYTAENRRSETKVKKGENGTAYYVSATDWGDGTNDKPKNVVIATYEYFTATTTKTSGEKTSYTYTFHDTSDTQIKTIDTTLPSIATGQNGSGTATVSKRYFDDRGRLRWSKDGEGYVNYVAQHPDLGGAGYRMVDVNTSSLDSDITSGSSGKWIAWSGGVPTGFTRDGGLPTALELETKVEYDDQGRQKKITNPGGDVHYTLYQDDQTERFSYWNSTVPILPISVTKFNDAGRVIEQFTVDPDRTAQTSNVPTGLSAGTTQAHYITWSTNEYDDNGALTQSDRYHDIPSSGSGTLSTNFYRTIQQYDDLGRTQYTIQVVSGTAVSASVEQVTKNTYDVLNRTTKVERAVSGSSHNMTSDYDTYPTVKTVSATEYNKDGRVTKSKRYHGTGANDYTGAGHHLTYRGFLRGVEPFYHNGSSETAIGPFSVQDVNWRGQVVASAIYDTEPTWSTVISDDDYADTVATDRRSLSITNYDDLGRAYQSERITITASTGAKGDKSVSNTYYDRNGRQVAAQVVNHSATEIAFDGAGRQYQSRTVLDLEATKYSSGAFQYRAPVPTPTYSSLTGGDDKVIALSHTEFDSGGNTIKQFSIENDDADTDGIDLTNDDDYIQTFVYSWYDNADRITDTANYGTATTTWTYYGTAPTYGGSAPTRSDTILVTSFSYDVDSGRLDEVTDPEAIETKTFYDDLGRTTYIAENYDNFVASSEANTGDATDTSKDRVTKTVYNGLGQTTERIAMDADGNGNLSDNQSTEYLFESTYNAALNTNIIYPDSSDTTSAGSDQVKLSYNIDGSLSQKTDQLGTVINYTYTNDRKQDLIKVTTLGTNVDGHVRSIDFDYDDLGRRDTVTSYANSDGTGTVRNEIVFEYDDRGAVSTSWQEHVGAKDGSTLNVQYAYDTSASSGVYDDGPRMNQVTYPDGRVINYVHGTAGDEDDLLNRLDLIEDGSNTDLVQYQFMGTEFVIETTYSRIDLRLVYDWVGSDQNYELMDRFGRPIVHWWDGYNTTADAEVITYGYDRVGNPNYRDISSGIYSTNDKDQKFTYDGLHRLSQTNHGTLVSGDITDANADFRHKWGLDQLGNWADFQEDANGDNDFTDAGDQDQDRTHNDANEITGITEGGSQSAWIDPVYNAAGNMTEGPLPGSETTKHKYVYDAFNRLVKITDSSDVSQVEYEYDGMNRRIRKTDTAADPDVDYDYYYNESWQLLEVRKDQDTNPLKQHVWHDYYIDALAITWYDDDTDGSDVDELYFTDDVNFNVTAVLGDTGAVQERYEYDTYGQPAILDADFSDDADGASDWENNILFAGYQYDPDGAIYHARFRTLAPSIGRWMQRDPIELRMSPSLYQYVSSRASLVLDPLGLQEAPPAPPKVRPSIQPTRPSPNPHRIRRPIRPIRPIRPTLPKPSPKPVPRLPGWASPLIIGWIVWEGGSEISDMILEIYVLELEAAILAEELSRGIRPRPTIPRPRRRPEWRPDPRFPRRPPPPKDFDYDDYCRQQYDECLNNAHIDLLLRCCNPKGCDDLEWIKSCAGRANEWMGEICGQRLHECLTDGLGFDHFEWDKVHCERVWPPGT